MSISRTNIYVQGLLSKIPLHKVTEALPVKLLVQISASSVFLYFAYRGLADFNRNTVMINITEVVNLPPSGTNKEVIGPLSGRLISNPIRVRGKIECETCTMRSYRFLLKLGAIVKTNDSIPQSGRGVRKRVVSCHVSPSDANTGELYRTTMMDDDALREGGLLTHATNGRPTIIVDNTHSMVDTFELENSGHLCFTPACVSEAFLLGYTTVAQQKRFDPTSHNGKPRKRQDIVLQNCYVQADEATSRSRRLSFEISFYNSVHGVKVVIQLPHRFCNTIAIHTAGIGKITLPDANKQHRFVWEIDEIDENTWKYVKQSGRHIDPHGPLARCRFTDDEVQAGTFQVEKENSRKQIDRQENRRELRYPVSSPMRDSYGQGILTSTIDSARERPESSSTDRTSAAPDGALLLSANFFVIYEDEGVEYDCNSESDSDDPGDEEEIEFSYKLGNRSSPSKVSRKSKQSNMSSKERKREERALKKKRLAASHNSADIDSIVKGTNTKLPIIELTYSTAGLVSGLAIKKLQTVEDRPNWIPRNRFDRYILRKLFPNIENTKLTKLAHYSTLYVQAIGVTLLQ